ncbi:MAG: aspartate carbamoyltransferase regulatory subunit [Halobacteriales archaeon]|nr:aspartate carbamoyltransferase regulatory subunit [Halobacteriales archaeon]
MTDRELHVAKIQRGTVIDHIAAGQALNVLTLLGIDGSAGEAVSVAMNVPSGALGRKDIVKVENRELSQDELDVLSLIAPDATVNIIRDYAVEAKHVVERPDAVEGVLECPNSACITNADEPVETHFTAIDEGVRCAYCGTIVHDDIADRLGE